MRLIGHSGTQLPWLSVQKTSPSGLIPSPFGARRPVATISSVEPSFEILQTLPLWSVDRSDPAQIGEPFVHQKLPSASVCRSKQNSWKFVVSLMPLLTHS